MGGKTKFGCGVAQSKLCHRGQAFDEEKDQEKPADTKSEAAQGRGKSEASRGRSATRSPKSCSRPLSLENRAADDYQGGGWWRQKKPRGDNIQDAGAGQKLQEEQEGQQKWGREAYPPSEPSEKPAT